VSDGGDQPLNTARDVTGRDSDAGANGTGAAGTGADEDRRDSARAAGGPGPGRQLREARERLGVSEREVAEALNLPPQVIEAMEADDAAKLPGAVFARGYLRSYAKLLELDAEQLLGHYPSPAEETEISELAPLPLRPWWQDNPLWPFRGLVAAALVLLVLMIWLWPGGDEPAVDEPVPDRAAPGELPAPGESGTAATDDTDLRLRSALDGADRERVAVDSADPLSRASAAEAPVPAPSTAPASSTVGSMAVATEEAAADAAQRLTPSGSDRLTLSFSEDCWVEVRAADGDSLYSDLNRTGDTLTLVGQAPFRVLLGYAPGVRLDFNGEAVPLSPHTRNNVATLVLGQ